ncbi:unnamed protein product [Caenorhabditis auriculariae]|uniref:H/ACA ribonucleoprotein complex subunit 2 n=1 Tax=Caenorhabditis auriculariae TaxID=2777116 RepID=A0A8S1GNR2_9PELO|nr:unnamed protein product [Caenorhabditis auriculariae]
MGKKRSLVEEEPLNDSVASESAETLLTEKDDYAALCALVNPIAQPLANRKLAKKVYKLVKKVSGDHALLREGIKDVQKAIRKGEKGIVILAGNVSPIDVYSHIPAICEEKGLPYAYVPSREQLGLAIGHRRPSIITFIRPSDAYQELYTEVADTLNHLTTDTD